MPRIDRGNLGLRRRSRCSKSSRQLACHQERRTACRALRRFAKSHFVSLDCEAGYGSNVSGSASNEYLRGRLRLMKPPMVQANQTRHADQKQRAGEFGSRKRPDEKSDHGDRQQRQHRNRHGIGHRPDAADQGSLAACRLHPSMQLGDEGAVALVLRRHQRDGLPGRRKDGDPPLRRPFRYRRESGGIASTSVDTTDGSKRYRHTATRRTGGRSATTIRHPSVRIDTPTRSVTPCRRS